MKASIVHTIAGAVTACALTLCPTVLTAQDGKAMVLEYLDTHGAQYGEVAQAIWDFAEVGYQEEQSSALLQSTLAAAGFEIEAGVAEIPTAFVATYGHGSPVIGLLAEFDALPGFTQDRVAVGSRRSTWNGLTCIWNG